MVFRAKEENWTRFVGESKEDPWGHVYKIYRGKLNSIEIEAMKVGKVVTEK